MTGNEKTTALVPSVGADGGQPPHDSTNQSIPHETCESNPPEENIEEMREKIRRMNDPHYLHTVSMTELYQTAYKSRPPVIDGLLYSGAYILAGAPKIGKLCLELEPFRLGTLGRTRLKPFFPRDFTKASPSGESLVICHPYLSPLSTVKAPVASAVALNFLLWYRPEREVS